MNDKDRILTSDGPSKSLTKEVTDEIVQFLAEEIGGKAIDGITYALLLKDDPKDKAKYEEYLKLKQQIRDCGYANDEVLRLYEVCNGYICDLDLGTTKYFVSEMIRAVNRTKGIDENTSINLLGDSPDKRRKHDILGLAKLIMREMEIGNNTLDVVLFSRNQSDKIKFSAEVKKTDDAGKNTIEKVVMEYPAYAIRHWDIETLNAQVLIPQGLKVRSIVPCEILPYRTGVRFTLNVEQIY